VSSQQEALVNDLSGYVFSPLRKGDIALYRGFGNGLAPVVCTENFSGVVVMKSAKDGA
jgi:hypothetical protein